jgi:hypothetical protein
MNSEGYGKIGGHKDSVDHYTNRKIVLVRSPRELIEDGQIGYGWAVNGR